MRMKILAVVATAGLGVAIAVAVSAVASASPAGVHGLTQRTEMAHTMSLAHSTTELQATCRPDELRTGGGYQVGSIGHSDKIYVNAPTGDRAWLVEHINDTDFDIHLWAFAICVGGH
jgi:hypothetical protein